MSLFEYKVHTERNFQHHTIMMGTMDGNPVYLDFSSHMVSAGRSDEKRGYRGIGPAQGIEIQRAKEYAEFCRPAMTADNMNKFNTVQRDRSGAALFNTKGDPIRGYSFFTDTSNVKKDA